MRFTYSLLLLIAVAACAGGAQPIEPPTRGAQRGGAPDAALHDAQKPAMAKRDAGDPAKPDAPTALFDGKQIEVACNGTDDDGDGLVDVLLPVGPNECATGLTGACGAGIAVCEGGKRACLAPPPMPEVADGIDNDCNGVVDDVPQASVRPRALLLAPKYAWTDAAPDVANVAASLAQAGIPFDRPANGSDWASVAKLDEYALAVVPGYLLGAVLTNVRDKLEAFVERGGVLIVFKPIGEKGHVEALTLAGLRAGTRHHDVEELRLDGVSTPATAFVDSVEERSLGINAKGEKTGVEVWTYEPDPEAKTEVLATAYRSGAAVGAVFTRRRIGKGAVYAVGHDLASFGAPRCYMNCFESAGDVMRLFFDGALREASQGHVAIVSTMPALASSVLVLTHDVNTREGLFSGAWGEPGALQLAKVEKERGVHATFHVMTDYRSGNHSAATVRELCALGMCPTGIQGVQRVLQFARLGDGMVRVPPETGPWRCKETIPTYATPSLCGEIFLSSQLIQSSGSKAPRAWRSPFMAYHAELIQMLASAGIQFDSSFGIGDLPYNVPLDMATTGVQQRRFHRRPILEFPLTLDDAIELKEGGKTERIELQPSTEARFRALWQYILLENQRNRSFTTLRVNAGRGEKMAPENLHEKTVILGRFLDDVARPDRGLLVRSVEETGAFWRARLDAQLEARFESASGYKGTLTIGKTTTAGLAIELGDAVRTFDCPKCGETKIAGKRVAIVGALPPGTKLEFTATVR